MELGIPFFLYLKLKINNKYDHKIHYYSCLIILKLNLISFCQKFTNIKLSSGFCPKNFSHILSRVLSNIHLSLKKSPIFYLFQPLPPKKLQIKDQL